MFKGAFTLAAIAVMSITGMASTADAHGWEGRGGWHDGYRGDHYYRGGGYEGRRYYDRRGYYGRSYYGRGYSCDRGTGGTIIGAIAGGLLGHEVAKGRSGRGDGTAGAIVGAGVGALAGRAIDRDC